MSGRDGVDAPYWRGLGEGKLVLPRCTSCSAWRWPAGRRCSACGTSGTDWIEQPPRATVFSWTRTWHRFGLTDGLDLPFTSVIAALDGSGIRLMGRLEDPDCVDPVIGESLSGLFGTTTVGARAIPTIIWSRTA